MNQILSHYFFLRAVCLANWKLFSISYRLQEHFTLLIEHYRKGHPIGVLHHPWHRSNIQWLGRKRAKRVPLHFWSTWKAMWFLGEAGANLRLFVFILWEPENDGAAYKWKPGSCRAQRLPTGLVPVSSEEGSCHVGARRQHGVQP